MSRIFFRKADPAYVTVSGGVVSTMQTALNAASRQVIKVDGIFGGQTRDQIRSFQASTSLPVTGEMDEGTWKGLMHTAEPTMFERALQVTAHFEGTGFTRVVGDFDGAGLTWGIIGFTLSNGELSSLLVDISRTYPAIFNEAFGSDAAVILEKMALPPEQRLQWARTISRGPKNMNVAEPWRTYLNDLGNFPEIQAIQTARARDRYWTVAVRDAQRLGLDDERDYALLYDVAVQNGGLGSKSRSEAVRSRFAAAPVQNQDVLRGIVIDVIVEASNPKFRNDVRQRKATINAGRGTTHGSEYLLSDWGIQAGSRPTILE